LPVRFVYLGRGTIKDNGKNTTLYLSVFDWPKDGKLLVPGLTNKIVSAKFLTTGTKLKTGKAAEGMVITVPADALNPIATVIKLEVKGKVASTMKSVKGEMRSGL
jgi:alpha-L-fucosidase